VEEIPSSDELRFDHYAVVRRDDGAFEELGRDAMGVTNKALDIVLGRAVGLEGHRWLRWPPPLRPNSFI
jgi:hypothetical protein